MAKVDYKNMSDAELARRIKDSQNAEKIRDQKEIASMKAKGFTHRVRYVVHPKNGGDDLLCVAYTVNKPTDAQIQKLLRRSMIKTDFVVESI